MVLVCAVAALSVSLIIGSGPTPVRLDAKTVADRALVAIKFAANDYLATHSVMTGATGVVLESNREWHDGPTDRIETYGPSGAPIRETWSSRKAAGSTIINLYFSRHEYFEKANISTGSSGTSGSQPYAQLNQEIALGLFSERGSQEIDGAPTIELQRTSRDDTLTIWVDVTTYLPLRWANTQPSGATNTTDLTWNRKPSATETSALSRPLIPAGYALVQHLLDP
jgi:hypothetical protein